MKSRRGVQTGGASHRFVLLWAFFMVAALLGMCSAAFADTVFTDNFEGALSGWSLTGSVDWYTGTPRNGTHSVQLKQAEAIERLVSTAGYSNITVSFALAANSLDSASEIVRASWSDGATWTVLKQIRGGDGENDGVLRTYSYMLPVAANDNPNLRLRFEIIANNHGNDFGYVDDVLVTGQLVSRTLTLSGSGNGSVLVDGVLHALPWSGLFVQGTAVTLEAIPDVGWGFASWSGDVSGLANPLVVTVAKNTAIIANFSRPPYTLSLTGTGSGAVKVNGTPYSLPWSGSFPSGSSVTLEAVPQSGWAFESWSGSASGNANPITTTIDGPKTITANFTQLYYMLSLTGSGSGSVAVNGTTHSLPWSGSFLSGSSVTLDALPGGGWQFDSWSGDASGSADPIAITMDAPKSIAASFITTSYTLSLTGAGSGSVKVNGTPQSLPWSGAFASHTQVTVEAVPASGWKFALWTGPPNGTTETIVVNMNKDRSLTASFSQLSYTLSLTGIGNGTVKVNGATVSLPYSKGLLSWTEVTLEAVADSGWGFDYWSGDASGSANPIIITMDAPKTVSATFDQLSYTLTLDKVGNGSIKVNNVTVTLPYAGQFLSGTEVTLEAIADSGWNFSSWSGDLSASANPATATMDGDRTIAATFKQLSYLLSLAKTGNGSVSVNGLEVPLPYSGQFLSGTEVTLEAAAHPGWEFGSWSGDVSVGSNPVVVTMDGGKSVTASFNQLSYTLSLDKVGNGTVKVNGTTVALPYSAQFVSATDVTVEAVAQSGWAFSSWSGDESGSSNPIVVTMHGDRSVTANFDRLSYTLLLDKVGSGSIKVNGAAVALPYSAQFLSGTNVTVEAVAASGWGFGSWSGDVSGGSSVVVTMDGPKSGTATFNQLSYTLSLAKVGSGSIEVNGATVGLPYSGQFLSGTVVTVRAIPAAGWEFGSWSGDATGSVNPLTVTMATPKSVTATFNQLSYTLTLARVGNGSIEVNGATVALPYAGQFLSGTDVTVDAVAASGWEFGSWSGDVTDGTDSLTVTMDTPKSVTAIFDQLSYTLSLTMTGNGTLKVNGTAVTLPYSAHFLSGTQVTVEAGGRGSQKFLQWSGDATGTTNPLVVTMSSAMQITAGFMCIEGVFPDVACDFWAANEIGAARNAGVVQGYPDGLYRPAWAVNRDAMAVYIARAIAGGQEQIPEPTTDPKFPDVPADHWAYSAVEYCVALGVVQGYGDGSYQPTWEVTRGQMSVFIARAIADPIGEDGLASYQPPANPTFSDVPTSYWCYKHVENLASQAVVLGYPDGTYRPTVTVTRDQMAVYITRAFGLF